MSIPPVVVTVSVSPQEWGPQLGVCKQEVNYVERVLTSMNFDAAVMVG